MSATPTPVERPAPPADPRLDRTGWGPDALGRVAGRRLLPLVVVDAVAACWYFSWLLRPERVGQPVLYALLVVAEVFNVGQAIGFWWTLAHERSRPRRAPAGRPTVDVLVPVYTEPVEVVEPTLRAARRLRGGDVRVILCDDGDSRAMRALAARVGAGYLRRTVHSGAKAGNLNAALSRSSGTFVLVLDCDHVPHEDFLLATLGHFDEDRRLAFVQTPQYYANARGNSVAAASWAQQALFFGCIGRGKDGLGAMFCCGTNVVFRREALLAAGGFPEESVTEDFLLSVRLHEQGWRSAYVPEVLAQGLGPEDMASWSSQQLRWARGCLSAIPTVLTARLPWRLRLSYLLSATYFLSGFTVLLYMSLPVLRILTGMQPLSAATADQFLLHFVPYFALALTTVAAAGGGTYTFAAYAQQWAGFWIHVVSAVRALLRRSGRFVVTPKRGREGWQPGAVWPALVMLTVLVGASGYGLVHAPSAATLNNVAFAGLHVFVLLTGVAPALRLRRRGRLRAGVSAGAEPVGREQDVAEGVPGSAVVGGVPR